MIELLIGVVLVAVSAGLAAMIVVDLYRRLYVVFKKRETEIL